MNQIQCPNCKSFKTYNQRNILVVTGIFLISLGITFGIAIIPLIFIPVGIAVIIGGLSTKKEKAMKCRSCDFQFPKTEK